MASRLTIALLTLFALYAGRRVLEFRRALRRVRGVPGFRTLFNIFVPLPWQYAPGIILNMGHFQEEGHKRASWRARAPACCSGAVG